MRVSATLPVSALIQTAVSISANFLVTVELLIFSKIYFKNLMLHVKEQHF